MAEHLSILLIEDDEACREELATLLSEEGYLVDGVSSGEAALGFLRMHPNTSLIVLDLVLPGMNGWEFRKKQLADSELSHIPCIVFSGHAAEFIGEDFRVCGIVNKLGDLDALFALINRCIQENHHGPRAA